MAVPVVVVGGFLGAGKTSLINRIVNRCAPLRLSVLVNDFGALAIDSDLIEQAGERIVTLKNGCVCCSLQGDLLASIRVVLSRPDPPDAVLVECSGVSRIGAVRDALLDPVIWRAAALEAVVCVADAADMAAD
ncbi:GTP-binding protein, partial [Nguyenibacter vanlangensis]